ncbi:hypothetical protein CBM2585_B50163 [Cupriavidus taiwanensis]|nr:hypothetical protein CBM2585_B50163 [Cupriavidus taiwanensis]
MHAPGVRVNARDSGEGRCYIQFGVRCSGSISASCMPIRPRKAPGRVEHIAGPAGQAICGCEGSAAWPRPTPLPCISSRTSNARFAKESKRDFLVAWPLRGDEDGKQIFSWREWRKMSESLSRSTTRLWVCARTAGASPPDSPYLEVGEFPDGRIAVWARRPILHDL